jgi:oligopeptidase B
MVRGGGDDTMAWADAARTWKREASIEDFESVISTAQKQLDLTASHTAIYGRSAGGILVGATAARQIQTRLFKALYAEVPYLDLLRTTTNPTLPLTKLEYDEFGNPARRIEDLVSLAKVSPLNQIPEIGFPKLFALMRTGQNDNEVYAYEPVKWILRSRGKNTSDSTKLLAIEPNEGHFVSGASGLRNRAVDLCLLLAWNQGATFKL